MATSTPSLTPEATIALQNIIDTACAGDKHKLPGAVVHIVDAKNNTIFSHAAGGPKPLSAESITTQLSFTKIVGAVALFQLVEHGIVDLDDVDLVERILPELASKQVCTGFNEDKTPVLEPRKGQITPRMLMNHTNGTAHSFFHSQHHEYLTSINPTYNEATDPYNAILHSPLFWQPGTHLYYGQGFDWIAVLIERLTEQSLATYLERYIFAPLGMKHTGFEETFGGSITTDNEHLFWQRSLKMEDGAYMVIDPTVLPKREFETPFPKGKYHAFPLGTGLVSSAADWCLLLTTLANEGLSPVTGNRVLRAESVKQISSPQVPEELRGQRQVTAAAPIILPVGLTEMDPEGSFGFGCGVQGKEKVLRDGKRGWGKGTIYWYGAANTGWWVDFEKGVCGVVEGAYFPWNDGEWLDFVDKVEGTLYEGLN